MSTQRGSQGVRSEVSSRKADLRPHGPLATELRGPHADLEALVRRLVAPADGRKRRRNAASSGCASCLATDDGRSPRLEPPRHHSRGRVEPPEHDRRQVAARESGAAPALRPFLVPGGYAQHQHGSGGRSSRVAFGSSIRAESCRSPGRGLHGSGRGCRSSHPLGTAGRRPGHQSPRDRGGRCPEPGPWSPSRPR